MHRWLLPVLPLLGLGLATAPAAASPSFHSTFATTVRGGLEVRRLLARVTPQDGRLRVRVVGRVVREAGGDRSLGVRILACEKACGRPAVRRVALGSAGGSLAFAATVTRPIGPDAKVVVELDPTTRPPRSGTSHASLQVTAPAWTGDDAARRFGLTTAPDVGLEVRALEIDLAYHGFSTPSFTVRNTTPTAHRVEVVIPGAAKPRGADVPAGGLGVLSAHDHPTVTAPGTALPFLLRADGATPIATVTLPRPQ